MWVQQKGEEEELLSDSNFHSLEYQDLFVVLSIGSVDARVTWIESGLLVAPLVHYKRRKKFDISQRYAL
jgi:hypothetical protein